jgi:hypothetical protein
MAETNPRLGISVNLPTGATYDLLIVESDHGFPEGKLTFKFYDTPRKITGIQKVAQLFLKFLLTNKGTDVLNPSRGTVFPDLAINANRTGVDHDLHAALTAEVREAERQCKSTLNSVDSDDASQLDSISVLGLDTGDDFIVMYLRVLTRAGVAAQVSIPFPQLDMSLST